ncbi:MAG: hypothetical protein EA401_02495, partial [Planctomycetota bacterium]
MQQIIKLSPLLVIMGCILALLSACGSSQDNAAAEAQRMAEVPEIPNFDGSQFDGPNLQRVREAGVLVLAYANEAPFGYRD